MVPGWLAELAKLRKRPAVWLLVLAWWLLALVFGYLFPYLAYRSGIGPRASLGRGALLRALPADLVPTAVQGFPLFAGALALLIGVLATGSEYGWGTLKMLLSQQAGRGTVIVGKVAALVTVLLAVVVASFGLDAAASAIVAGITHSAMHWPSGWIILRGLAGGWLMVTMWGLAGVTLAIATRGTALAAGIGLVWALAVENLLRAFASLISGLDQLIRYLPGTNAGALAAALGSVPQDANGGTPGITDVVGAGHATAVLLGYAALFLAVSVALIRRRDVS
jgi:ABC-type transport system involved in multi-copper enzyme maturation permease subunit